ncbi:MAG: fumarylacetoacetate hydrolase family protein [Firmicutes bacterium]|nr:fumarylacetoacetate hydrolase family protein [Bacillota bacterium]
MKLARFVYDSDVRWGVVEGEDIFSLIGSVYGEFEKGDFLCKVSEVKLLAPAEPRITVACGLNYREHVKELKMEFSEEPTIFFKPVNTINVHEGEVIYPSVSSDLRYEAELCCVMKKETKNVSPDEALDYVLGYTCGNDLTLMDLQLKDGNLTRSKGFDTSGPLGQFLVTGLDPQALRIRSWVNGELKQDGNTKEMIFKVPEIISLISTCITLYPGDVVWTGTPSGGACPVKVGDVIEIEIEGIGLLRNSIKQG